MAENNWHETKIRVRYKETDSMGVVYYGNYLTFFEVGRNEFMRHIGFPYSGLEADGYVLVVTEACAKYHSNVGYDSQITVKTKITDVRKVRVRFEYEVVDEDSRLLVSGHTVHAFMNSLLKPTRILPEIKEVMEESLKS